MEEVLTDCGTEDPFSHEEALPTHEVERTYNRLAVKHTTIKAKHSLTNVLIDRPTRVLLNEFHPAIFRRKRRERAEMLPIALNQTGESMQVQKVYRGIHTKASWLQKAGRSTFLMRVDKKGQA
jgi:hypothetical protein